MVVTENDSGSFCWWVQMRRLNSCFERLIAPPVGVDRP